MLICNGLTKSKKCERRLCVHSANEAIYGLLLTALDDNNYLSQLSRSAGMT